MLTELLPSNEEERLSALQQYRLLDAPSEEALNDLVTLAAHICATPIAYISLVDSDRQWVKSALGDVPVEMTRDVSFCSYCILNDGLMIVEDTTQDERFVNNPLLKIEPAIRFYAGTSLTTREGLSLGALAVMDYSPRNLTPSQMEALNLLGRQVMRQFDMRLHLQALVTAVNNCMAGLFSPP